MRRMPWTTYAWPGLPQLWLYGSWSGLALAIGAATALDILLVTSFGWSELIDRNWRITIWTTFASVWLAAIAWSIRQCRDEAGARGLDAKGDLFAKALDHYLQGDYYQTEQILENLLRRNARDLEARLMLATLLRHVGRLDEAERQLDILGRFEDADKWELEIENEHNLLTEAKTANATAA